MQPRGAKVDAIVSIAQWFPYTDIIDCPFHVQSNATVDDVAVAAASLDLETLSNGARRTPDNRL